MILAEHYINLLQCTLRRGAGWLQRTDAVPRLIWRLFKQSDASETAPIMPQHSHPMNVPHLFHVISGDEGQRLFVVV